MKTERDNFGGDSARLGPSASTCGAVLSALREHIRRHNPEQEWVLDRAAFLHVGGSTLYGTNSPASDLDIRGVTIAPKSFWVGARGFEQLEAKLPDLKAEVVIYDIRKFLRLSTAVNPNVIETLFIPDDHPCAVRSTAAWQFIRTEAVALLNQRAHEGFHGYATSQLKKMVVKQSNKTGRRDITDEYGFDLKFAAHGFRLAAQGAELMRTWHMTFPRPERDFLRAVRFGQIYGPADLDRCVADLTAASQELDRALAETILPAKVDFERYDRLLMQIYDECVAP